MTTVLVTGGAGYIGSQLAWRLIDAGYEVVVLDDLSTGDAGLVPPAAELVVGKAGHTALVCELLSRHGVSAVIHLAGSTSPAESLAAPLVYYQNNLIQTVGLVEACRGRVKGLIFSSTAAVYAAPGVGPVSERSPLAPATPYGQSKLMAERVIADGLDAPFINLRYFNVAGCDPHGRTGHPAGRANLIQAACAAAVHGPGLLKVFGTDYPTHDGSGVRDFIHVWDLAEAHLLALEHLLNGGASTTLNCGYGRGCSVFEVARMVGRLGCRPLSLELESRRPGDHAQVVADVARLKATLPWRPQFDSLDKMVATTLAWETARKTPAVVASAPPVSLRLTV